MANVAVIGSARRLIAAFLVVCTTLSFAWSTTARADTATAYTAIQDGDWTDPVTWGGTVPVLDEPGDSVLIPSGVTVTVPEGESVSLLGGSVSNDGSLHVQGDFFFRGDDAELPNGSLFRNTGSLRVLETGKFEFEGPQLLNGKERSARLISAGPITNLGEFILNDADASNVGQTTNSGVLTIWPNTDYTNGGTFTNFGSMELLGYLGNRANLRNTGSFTNGDLSLFTGGALINTGHAENHGTFFPQILSNKGVFENYHIVKKVTLHAGHWTTNKGGGQWMAPGVQSGVLVNEAAGTVVVGNVLYVAEGAALLNFGLVEHGPGPVINNGTIADACGGIWTDDGSPGSYEGNPRMTLCDATPPTVTPVVAGAEGTNGWYVSNVDLSWNIGDLESAVLYSTGCDSDQVLNDTPGRLFTCTSTSAGGTSVTPALIKRDTEPPPVGVVWDDGNTVVNEAVEWFNHRLQATFYMGSDLSAPSGSCDDPLVLDEGEGQLVDGSCTDGAGNTGTFSLGYPISIDLTPPAVIWEASSEPNAADWYNSEVTVTYSGTDALSDIDYCDDPVTFDTDGADQRAWRACWDNAGNSTEVSPTISMDTTPPTITARLSAPANSDGWHNTEVDVIFEGSDATSGIDLASCDLVQLAVEGIGLSASGACTDLAGNIGGTVTVDNINIDLTDPLVGFANATTSYLLSDLVNITCVASDALSGIETINCTGANGYGYEFDHTADIPVSVSAWDRAGNTDNDASSFTIQVTPEGIAFVIDQYVADEKLARDLKGELDRLTRSGDKKKDKGKTTDKMSRFEEAVLQGISQDDLTSDEADHLITLVRFHFTPSVSVVTGVFPN